MSSNIPETPSEVSQNRPIPKHIQKILEKVRKQYPDVKEEDLVFGDSDSVFIRTDK